MTANQPTNLRPTACFVVEREPGKGYQVTSAEGSYTDEWKGRALALLDALGQPDPRGPAESFRWVGPVALAGEYVGVSVKLMPNGEARYHQAWFQFPKPAPAPARSIGLRILVMFVIFAVGAIAGRALFTPGGAPTPIPVSGDGGLPVDTKVDTATTDIPPGVRLTKLKTELASSRDLRAKLRRFLSQEGFAADISTSVVDEKRSVKVIADLDKTPPPQESIRISNVEVAKLEKLLETLDEWTTNSKALPKSEGQ